MKSDEEYIPPSESNNIEATTSNRAKNKTKKYADWLRTTIQDSGKE